MTLRTKANQNFNERIEAKKERYSELAEKNERLSDQTFDHARKMASVIPFGQPILVGHHSEKGDRRYRARIENTYRKSSELYDKSKYYAEKAENYGSGGIMSDDPEAMIKLKEKIEMLTVKRDKLKRIRSAVNSLLKKYKTVMPTHRFQNENYRSYDHEAIKKDMDILKNTLSSKLPEIDAMQIELLLTEDFGRYGVSGWQVTSLTTRIREAKKRLEYMEREEERAEINWTFENGIEVKEEEGRINIYFDGKPEEAVRSVIKRSPYAFKWSRYNACWTRKKTSSMGKWFFNDLEKYLKSL